MPTFVGRNLFNAERTSTGRSKELIHTSDVREIDNTGFAHCSVMFRLSIGLLFGE